MHRFVALALILLTTVGCHLANPVVTATGALPENQAETVAFALHNSYVVVAERAATIAEDSTTPRAVKRTLVRLHEAASPVAKDLKAKALAYEEVRKAVAAGTSTADKLKAAFDALNRVITEAAPKIDSLATAVGAHS